MANNYKNFGQSLGAEAGLWPPASKTLMLSVLQLQGNEFCPRTRSLEADPFVVEPPDEDPALANSDDSL